MSLQISHEGPHFGPKTTAESVIFRAEYDMQTTVDKIVERVNRRIDEATLAKVEGQLAEYGYVKVVRCRDCAYYYEHGVPTCQRNKEWFTGYDINGTYGEWCDGEFYVEPDGFCAWGSRKEDA